jgi:multisubunit Na+/H+ antiporter MnhE subunit
MSVDFSDVLTGFGVALMVPAEIADVLGDRQRVRQLFFPVLLQLLLMLMYCVPRGRSVLSRDS